MLLIPSSTFSPRTFFLSHHFLKLPLRYYSGFFFAPIFPFFYAQKLPWTVLSLFLSSMTGTVRLYPSGKIDLLSFKDSPRPFPSLSRIHWLLDLTGPFLSCSFQPLPLPILSSSQTRHCPAWMESLPGAVISLGFPVNYTVLLFVLFLVLRLV